MIKWLAAALLISGTLIFTSVVSKRDDVPTSNRISNTIIPTAAPPCPWRDAETDLTNWFPTATGYLTHDVSLSGKRVELQQRLGRPPLPEENALHLYLIDSNHIHLGTVLTRRIKGPHGAIELAVALNTNGALQNFKIQRMREPAEIVDALAQINLEVKFKGKRGTDEFSIAPFERSVSSMTHQCLVEIEAAVKTLLISYEVAQDNYRPSHHR